MARRKLVAGNWKMNGDLATLAELDGIAAAAAAAPGIDVGMAVPFTLIAAAAPLSCAEGLEAACDLREDALDIVHSLATVGEIGATVLSFALLGLGFLRSGRREFGWVTFGFGALWLALTIVSGMSYLSDGVDEVKGAFQRVDQVVFGVWLVALAVAVAPRGGEGDPPPV